MHTYSSSSPSGEIQEGEEEQQEEELNSNKKSSIPF